MITQEDKDIIEAIEKSKLDESKKIHEDELKALSEINAKYED